MKRQAEGLFVLREKQMAAHLFSFQVQKTKLNILVLFLTNYEQKTFFQE